MKWRLAGALALMVATFGGVGTGPGAAQEPLVANPPLPTVALTLTARGRPQRYTVEVARTPVEQARGLMLRKTMGRGHGMLFPVDPPREASFWMEGTYLPLDIIFIAPDHSVRRIAANAVPFSKADIPSGGVAAAVLELNAGEAARIGLKPGDAVSYALD
jgi:uncharacterized membrane protein (UPF0127 family)